VPTRILTDKEIELVRYIRDESVKLDAVVVRRNG
jgi:hypothetical protein